MYACIYSIRIYAIHYTEYINKQEESVNLLHQDSSNGIPSSSNQGFPDDTVVSRGTI